MNEKTSNFLSEKLEKVFKKKQLRTKLKEKRKNCQSRLKLKLESKLEEFLSNLSPGIILGVYSSVGSEPDISNAVIEWANKNGVLVALPFVDSKENKQMHFRLWIDINLQYESVLDEMHILSTVGPKVIPDVIIIPCLGYSEEKHRLGYGGGFYDKYLASFRGKTVGLTFDELLVGYEIFEPHDIRLDVVITEKKIF